MSTFQHDGLDLAYDDIPAAGSPIGTVVLVHGFATSRAENWKRLGWYAALGRRGYRVVALDLRGHGESAKPHDAAAYGRAAMTGDVLALMDHLGLTRPHLVGYSMGAHLSLAIALTAPDRVDHLVLGGVGARLLEGTPLSEGTMTMAQALTCDDPETISDKTLKGFRLFAQSQGEDLAALAACSQGGGSSPDRDALRNLRPPCLVASGAWDDIAGDPQVLAEAIPGARCASIPGCDHFSAIAHALLKSAVIDFLEDWEEPPAFE